jgi:hypothetical protein
MSKPYEIIDLVKTDGISSKWRYDFGNWIAEEKPFNWHGNENPDQRMKRYNYHEFESIGDDSETIKLFSHLKTGQNVQIVQIDRFYIPEGKGVGPNVMMTTFARTITFLNIFDKNVL